MSIFDPNYIIICNTVHCLTITLQFWHFSLSASRFNPLPFTAGRAASIAFISVTMLLNICSIKNGSKIGKSARSLTVVAQCVSTWGGRKGGWKGGREGGREGGKEQRLTTVNEILSGKLGECRTLRYHMTTSSWIMWPHMTTFSWIMWHHMTTSSWIMWPHMTTFSCIICDLTWLHPVGSCDLTWLHSVGSCDLTWLQSVGSCDITWLNIPHAVRLAVCDRQGTEGWGWHTL